MHYDSSKNGDGSGFYTYEGRTVYVRSRNHTYGTNWKANYVVDVWQTTDLREPHSSMRAIFDATLGLIEVSVEVAKLEPQTAEGVAKFMAHTSKRADVAIQQLSAEQENIRRSLTHWQKRATEKDCGQRTHSIPWPPMECTLIRLPGQLR